MPDGNNFDFGFPAVPNPPDPPMTLWPTQLRPELIVDQYRTMLADMDGNLIGLPGPQPLARLLYAQRNQTRAI